VAERGHAPGGALLLPLSSLYTHTYRYLTACCSQLAARAQKDGFTMLARVLRRETTSAQLRKGDFLYVSDAWGYGSDIWQRRSGAAARKRSAGRRKGSGKGSGSRSDASADEEGPSDEPLPPKPSSPASAAAAAAAEAVSAAAAAAAVASAKTATAARAEAAAATAAAQAAAAHAIAQIERLRSDYPMTGHAEQLERLVAAQPEWWTQYGPNRTGAGVSARSRERLKDHSEAY